MPSSVPVLLIVLTGFGFPTGQKSGKQESRFFQLPLFRAIYEIEIQEKKVGNNLFQFLIGKIKKTPKLNSIVCPISVPVWYQTVFEEFLLEAPNVILL